MTDDFVADGILPDDVVSGDGEFDPNAFESDDILDDVDGEAVVLPIGVIDDELDEDEEDDLLEE